MWSYKGPDIPAYFSDEVLLFSDNADPTKQLAFQLANIAAGVIRTVTWPDKNGTVAMLDDLDSKVNSIQEGTRIDVDDTDPNNPIVSIDAATDAKITGIEAGAEVNTVNDVFGRQGNVTAENDDYSSDQIQIPTLDSSFYDFDFTGYGTLRAGDYQFQTLGANISNSPFVLTAGVVYNVRVKVNNNSWHSIEADFSSQGDELNQNRKWYRSGQTFAAAQASGWNERILQPQYEKLTSLEDFTNNPRPGQTTEGLINNTNVFETYLTQEFTPRRSGNFSCSAFVIWSLNDAGQDILLNLEIFDGATLIGSLPREVRIEPKDTAGGGIVLNLLSGGAIVGNANSSTNQGDPRRLDFDLDLDAGTTYDLVLSWAGSANGDLATIYSAQTMIKENL